MTNKGFITDKSRLSRFWAPCKNWVVGIVVGVGILSLLFAWAGYLVKVVAVYWKNELSPRAVNTITLEDLGQVGDLFGGANAMLSALAFLGVAIAAYYQRKTFLQ